MNRQKVFTVSLVIFMGLVCQTALGFGEFQEERSQRIFKKLYDHLQLLITELHNFSVFNPWHRKVSAILSDMQYYRPAFSQQELNALQPFNNNLVIIIKNAQNNFKSIYSGFTYLSPLTRQQMHKYYTNVLDYRLKKYFFDDTDFNIPIGTLGSVIFPLSKEFFESKKRQYVEEKDRIDQRLFFRGYYQRQLIIDMVKDLLDLVLPYKIWKKNVGDSLYQNAEPYATNTNYFLTLGEKAMKSPEKEFENFFRTVNEAIVKQAGAVTARQAGAATGRLVEAERQAERQVEAGAATKEVEKQVEAEAERQAEEQLRKEKTKLEQAKGLVNQKMRSLGISKVQLQSADETTQATAIDKVKFAVQELSTAIEALKKAPGYNQDDVAKGIVQLAQKKVTEAQEKVTEATAAVS